MDITVTARHFDVNNEIKKYAADSVEAAFADFRLKISSANMVLDMQRNLVSASITVAIKDNPVSASSQAYDNVYKAIDESIEKASAQARKFLDKLQSQKPVSMKETEISQAENMK